MTPNRPSSCAWLAGGSRPAAATAWVSLMQTRTRWCVVLAAATKCIQSKAFFFFPLFFSFSFLRDRETQRETEGRTDTKGECSCLLGHSPNVRNGWGWAWLKLGAGAPTRIAEPNCLSHLCCLPEPVLEGSRGPELELGTAPRLSDVGRGHLSH